MSPIGAITPSSGVLGANQIAPVAPKPAALPDGLSAATPSDGFGKMLDNLVSAVDAKQSEAAAVSNSVMLGGTDKLHQSVIAMQEASTALDLMVTVRNKLVESYQELMRMQV